MQEQEDFELVESEEPVSESLWVQNYQEKDGIYDSVTNVTKLNRINHRRVLLFIGNSDGIISYGKGKAMDYENAFDQAFKRLRQRSYVSL